MAKKKKQVRYQLCPRCEGRGTVVNPALSVWTEDDRALDPEGFEDMMEGRYDVGCPRCNGLRVVEVSREAEQRERERLEDLRTMAAESGDWDLYRNASLY